MRPGGGRLYTLDAGGSLCRSRPGPDRLGRPACRSAPSRANPWRKMPKRVRPYGSAEDAEFAGLGRSQPRIDDEVVSELGSTMTMREIADQAAEAVRALRDLTAGAG